MRVRTAILVMLGTLVAHTAGCNGNEEETLNEPSARNSLVTFLDTWKAGGTADSLLQNDPVITVTDTDWSAGATLVSYQLAAELINDGSNLETLVDLTLWRSGREEIVRAKYTISTHPTITISRTDAPSAS